LLHISELADHKVENPEDVVKVGDTIEVKVLRVDNDERKIGLSKKRVGWSEEQHQAEPPSEAAAGGGPKEKKKEGKELKGGLGGSGPLIQPAAEKEKD
jgi:small subunit ribosomal protein S1